MVLSNGTKLGPYEIGAPLCSGGMGELYRATQTSLNRQVAIKVLGSSVTADAERLHRFEQEARAASSLHHPNIISIYDIGRIDAIAYMCASKQSLSASRFRRLRMLRSELSSRGSQIPALPLFICLPTANGLWSLMPSRPTVWRSRKAYQTSHCP